MPMKSLQLDKAIHNYPNNLLEYQKDKQLAERTLSNVQNNVLLPASSSPPKIPLTSTMSVEIAEQIVKERPQEVKTYPIQHFKELEPVRFLTMGEVEAMHDRLVYS